MVVSKRGHRLEIKLARCFDPPPGSSTEIFPLTSTEHHNSFSNQTYRLSTKSITITMFTWIRAVALIKFFCNWYGALFRVRRFFESGTRQIIFLKLPALLISVTSRNFFWFWLAWEWQSLFKGGTDVFVCPKSDAYITEVAFIRVNGTDSLLSTYDLFQLLE